MAIGRLPAMDADAHRAHLERLDLIAGSAPSQQPPSGSDLGGPAAAYYETIARAPVWGWRPYLLRKASAHLKMRLWNLASPSVRNAMLRAQGALRSGRASDHRPER
jgi:hypothetical protein